MNIGRFDSLDDMMRQLHSEMSAADARLQPWQAAIKAGDYFRRNAHGIRISGEVLESPDACEPTLHHYRFCKCCSVVCPMGELGDVHVSTITRVMTATEFDSVRQRGWT